MKVLDGEIGVVGSGTWTDGGGGGKTILSVLEIGNHHLKRIVLPDYLHNYLTPGKQARVLIGRGLSRGVITRPFVAAVQVDGRTYKTDQVLLMYVLKCVLYCGVALLVFSRLLPVGLALAAAIVMFYAKEYLDLKRF